jgi:hypothetical protein
MNRSGTVLIVVAGICALLAGLTLTFIARTRSSVAETNAFEAGIQARIMLVAACSYVCESSRIGYEPLNNDPANGPHHVEAFGWIDVRDGSVGPNTREYRTGTTTGSMTTVKLWDASHWQCGAVPHVFVWSSTFCHRNDRRLQSDYRYQSDAVVAQARSATV